MSLYPGQQLTAAAAETALLKVVVGVVVSCCFSTADLAAGDVPDPLCTM